MGPLSLQFSMYICLGPQDLHTAVSGDFMFCSVLFCTLSRETAAPPQWRVECGSPTMERPAHFFLVAVVVASIMVGTTTGAGPQSSYLPPKPPKK